MPFPTTRIRVAPLPTLHSRHAAYIATLVIWTALVGLLGYGHPPTATRIRATAAVSRVVALKPARSTPKPSVAPQSPKPTPKPKVRPKASAVKRGFLAIRITVKAKPLSVREQVLAAWPGDDDWAFRTVNCETGGTWNPRATNPNGHYGLWQFGSWASSRDGMGDPRNQSPTVQTERAWALIKATSSSQWECSPYRYDP